ncbi:hypothetical protein F4808DRAFT_192585 [Astrocystis sublimbata]|nr:hypothetical protein F4808DRAFT_192585 [Astrocystis sublimbata]
MPCTIPILNGSCVLVAAFCFCYTQIFYPRTPYLLPYFIRIVSARSAPPMLTNSRNCSGDTNCSNASLHIVLQ